MAYCRFSSDNFKCDLYVYAAVDGGWMTHIADNRPVHDEPCPTLDFSKPEIIKQLEEQLEYMRKVRREPIGLPFDGQSFNDETPGECADRLVSLHELGYIFPLHIIDELRAEEQERQADATLAKTE